MYCRNCGKQITSIATECPYCKAKVIEEEEDIDTIQSCNEQHESRGMVIIHSYEEFYLVNMNIKVYIDGNLVATLVKGQTFAYEITKPTTIVFKCSIREAKVNVRPNVTTEIRLIWNRATGKLETVCNEQGNNETYNYINTQNYQGQLNAKKQSSNMWLAIIIILFLLLVLFL